MTKSIEELAIDVVIAQINKDHRGLEPLQIQETIKAVLQVFRDSDHSNADMMRKEPEDSYLSHLRAHPMEAIQDYQIICLESGKPFRLLSNRHLKLYGLTPTEYKAKWGYKKGQSLSCLKLTAKRRQIALDSGVGGKLREWRNMQNGINAAV